MSTTLLDGVVKKNRARLIPFMLALYVLAFLDRSNIGFAKETYQIDTGLSNEAYALGAGIFFVVYAFLGVPANLLMRKLGARTWIGTTSCPRDFAIAAISTSVVRPPHQPTSGCMISMPVSASVRKDCNVPWCSPLVTIIPAGALRFSSR